MQQTDPFGRWLSDAEVFVGLYAEATLRMRQTILQSGRRVRGLSRPIHRLKPKLPKIQIFEPFGPRQGLRVDKLQFLAAGLQYRRVRLWADADPISTPSDREGAIGSRRRPSHATPNSGRLGPVSKGVGDQAYQALANAHRRRHEIHGCEPDLVSLDGDRLIDFLIDRRMD